VQKSDRRHHGLLRALRERPRRRRAANERDEIAPLHSITQSARAVAGTSSPSVFAVFILGRRPGDLRRRLSFIKIV